MSWTTIGIIIYLTSCLPCSYLLFRDLKKQVPWAKRDKDSRRMIVAILIFAFYLTPWIYLQRKFIDWAFSNVKVKK